MRSNRHERAEMATGQIDEFLVAIACVNMELEIGLHPQAGGNDFAPDAR
jgi:hypothetical protein